jgi:hypothetical protein
MSWASLLAAGSIAREPTSKAELDDLRSIVRRSLMDALVPGLSDEARFVMAYDAARNLSVMLVRAEGYRPRTSMGGHYHTFLALKEVDPAFAPLSLYFDSCRRKRNSSEYTVAGLISGTDADDLVAAVQKFATEAEAWIKTYHPALA